MNTEITSLTVEQKTQIESAFAPVVTEKDALSSMYSTLITKEITVETAKEARELRLKLAKIS